MEAKERLNQLYNYFDTNARKIELLIKEKDSNTKFSRQSLYNIESGKTKSISFKLASEIINVFDGLNIEWLLTGKGNMILPNYNGAVIINQNKSNPVPISNGKSKNSNEGKVLKNDDVVKIKTFIIPIKGFAGLKHLFLDKVAEKHGIQSAQKMAGHLNGKTTEIYTIFKEKRELEELKKISFK